MLFIYQGLKIPKGCVKKPLVLYFPWHVPVNFRKKILKMRKLLRKYKLKVFFTHPLDSYMFAFGTRREEAGNCGLLLAEHCQGDACWSS